MTRTPKEEPGVFNFDFNEAIARVAQTDPSEVTDLVQASMPETTIESLLDRFEAAGHYNGANDKCWFAQDLMDLLGFDKCDNFERIIGTAMMACSNSGHPVADHFVEGYPQPGRNLEGGRPAGQFELTPYACYLIAQNVSSAKKQVSFAQTYFVILADRLALQDKNGIHFSGLSSSQQRLYLRNQIVEHNKRIASTAKGAGIDDKYFGKFQKRGHHRVYGGRGVDEIRSYKKLSPSHMDSTELAANLFRITQTDEKLRREVIRGRESAYVAYYEVGVKVRATMDELSGVYPENLTVAEDVKRVAAAERKQQKQRALAHPPPPPQKAAEQAVVPVRINLRADLWKYALLIMAVRPEGRISTSEMIAEMLSYIQISNKYVTADASRKDSKFSQLVRNLKSHRTTKTNFIYQGYAQDIPGGFQITRKGSDFVREYFKD